jgi:RNA polymerase-binding transcription factor DksA
VSKSTSKKTPSKKTKATAAVKSTSKSVSKASTVKKSAAPTKILLELRERLLGDILFLTPDNLHRAGRETGADLSGSAQHSADHGTDNFDREFALSLASTEQDVLYEVDEALMRIQEGEYGLCEMTGVQIERARLEVIPYTRYSVQAQSKMEQSRAKYRPFAQTFRGW